MKNLIILVVLSSCAALSPLEYKDDPKPQDLHIGFRTILTCGQESTAKYKAISTCSKLFRESGEDLNANEIELASKACIESEIKGEWIRQEGDCSVHALKLHNEGRIAKQSIPRVFDRCMQESGITGCFESEIVEHAQGPTKRTPIECKNLKPDQKKERGACESKGFDYSATVTKGE